MVRDIHTSNRRKQRKAMRSRCWVNGEEITTRCYYADDKRGIARVIVLSAEGHAMIDSKTGDVARAELRGSVRLARAAA